MPIPFFENIMVTEMEGERHSTQYFKTCDVFVCCHPAITFAVLTHPLPALVGERCLRCAWCAACRAPVACRSVREVY